MKQSVPAGSEQQQARQPQPAADMTHAENSPGFVDNRPETIALSQLKSTIRSSPKMIAQRNIGEMFHNNSREVAQRELYRSTKSSSLPLQAATEEKLLRGVFGTVQGAEDKELLQGKFEALQRTSFEEKTLQGKFSGELLTQLAEQKAFKPNKTGLSEQFKEDINSQSSMNNEHVKVHDHSSQIAPLNVHAYVQARVVPTVQMKDGVPVNDDLGLETETDVMKKGMQFRAAGKGDTGAEKADLAAYSTNGQMPVFRKSLPIPFGASGLQATAQLATEIKHTPGTVPFAGKNYMVGKKMIAKLDPDDPVKGSATTTDNYDWMKGIRAYYSASGVIRGHLLNHDLGGYGVPENLYPISSMANSQHSDRVEQKVKGALSDSASNTKNEIWYSVDVNEKGPGTMPYESAEFVCSWRDENGTVYNDVINSELNIDKGWGGKSAHALKSPSKWRHGSRRGEMDMGGVIAKNKIMIDNGPLGMTAPDYNKLRSDTTESKGIDDIQDLDEAIKMLANELDELGSIADPKDQPEELVEGIDYYSGLLVAVDEAKKSNKLGEFIAEESKRLMSNLIAIRKKRIYLQDGVDTESNIADESDEIEPMEV